MEYALGDSLRRAGFPRADIEQAADLYHRVNDFYRGRLPHRVVTREIEAARTGSWLSHVVPGEYESPEDPARDKWCYELDFDPPPTWRHVRQPTLFVFAGEDRWVPVDRSIAAYSAATGHVADVTFERIGGVNHFMGTGEDETGTAVSGRYLEILLDWLRAHL
jgi:pimeloyl-ACP methyl ester carboxylesterase